MTPGTPRSDGMCSLSYTSLKSASLSGRTLMAALKRYRVWIGMAVSFGGDRAPSSYLMRGLVASRPVATSGCGQRWPGPRSALTRTSKKSRRQGLLPAQDADATMTRQGIMTFGGIIFLLVFVGLVVAIVVTYNKLVGLRQRSEEAWSA